MDRTRLGCFSFTGLLAVAAVLLLAGGVSLAWGGVLFSPGPLNAQAGAAPLGGVLSHAAIAGRCAACHPAPWGQVSMTVRCLSCHTGVLDDTGNFHAVLQAEARLPACRECHREHRGAAGLLTEFDLAGFPHDAAGYSLQAHQQHPGGAAFACADCHPAGFSPFDPQVCQDCHQELDPAFMSAHLESFAPACLACHDGLDTYGAGFDHAATAFPLEGRHQEADCAGCHAGARSSADLQAAPHECYACHREDDEHQGQFGADCAACHTPQSWEEATFDHTRTAFPLEGRHLEASCRDCHTRGRYAGTPQACAACHADDDPHAGRLGQDCAVCHTPLGWDQVSFDHSQTAFPLIGKHIEVDCQNCHADLTFTAAAACYACHAADDHHNGRYGQSCELCHTPLGWEGVTFDHALTAFPLTGRHQGVDCLACHMDGRFSGTPTACASCHAEPAYHAGQFGAACQDCHTTAGWLPARFDRRHPFPFNHGERGANACRVCHPSTLSAYTCYQCHDANEIQEEHVDEGIRQFSDCARCHPTGEEDDD